MNNLTVELPVGFTYNSQDVKELELLPSNGISEKIFTKKLSEQPYTWQARVISAAVKSIAGIPIAAKVREQYLNTGDFAIPDAVKVISMADMNTLILEIHRRLWENKLPDQEFACKQCNKILKRNIDLDKITLLEEDIKFLNPDNGNRPDLSKIIVYLPSGFTIDEMKDLDRDDCAPYKGILFNKLTYRVPTIKDAINNERFAEDDITFWRRIAFDCLLKVEAVIDGDTDTEKVTAELPDNAKSFMGIRFYDLYLNGKDLKAIREELREYLPTMPFYYLDACPCDERKQVPHIMEATRFFSA